MNNTNSQSEKHFQKALSLRLNRTFHALQRLEQRMILTGHRSDRISSQMKKVRQNILAQLEHRS
ncbi:hypothetical protein [Endozoicomonas elysicola]|uniref:Uncharacterized protein n=1 Tax=Endozoicomonas elysicola TaxID=305900 RepID=A0A081K9M8_9GAMM|nr:hypothetical protein [Endozoicomonas elysicola]KEI70854.1 hypothetical protein GV64_08925 [Endozoicomonas elysicola]